MTRTEIPPGQAFIREGHLGREVVIIADGLARVTMGGQEVAAVGRGDVVGEMAVLDGGPRSATVTALTPVAAYVCTPAELAALSRGSTVGRPHHPPPRRGPSPGQPVPAAPRRRRPVGSRRRRRAHRRDGPQGPSSPGHVAAGRAAGAGDHVRVRPARSFSPFAGSRHAARPRCDRRPELEPRPRGAQRALPRRRPRPPGARTGHRRRRAVHPGGLRRRRRRPRRCARHRAGHLRRLLDGRADRPAGLASPRRAGPRARAVRDLGRVLLARRAVGRRPRPRGGAPNHAPHPPATRRRGHPGRAGRVRRRTPSSGRTCWTRCRGHDPLAVRDAARAVLQLLVDGLDR